MLNLQQKMELRKFLLGVLAMSDVPSATLGVGSVGRSGNYKLGNRILLPPVTIPSEAPTLVDYPSPDQYRRWRICLRADYDTADGLVPPPNVEPFGAGLIYTVTCSVEEGIIVREVYVGVNNAVTIYAMGTAINVTVTNFFNIDIIGTYQIDEDSPGDIRWYAADYVPFGVVPAAGPPYDLAYPPPFSKYMEILVNAPAGINFTLQARLGGFLAYSETFTGISRTPRIPLIPGARYSLLSPSAPNSPNMAILYRCEG